MEFAYSLLALTIILGCVRMLPWGWSKMRLAIYAPKKYARIGKKWPSLKPRSLPRRGPLVEERRIPLHSLPDHVDLYAIHDDVAKEIERLALYRTDLNNSLTTPETHATTE